MHQLMYTVYGRSCSGAVLVVGFPGLGSGILRCITRVGSVREVFKSHGSGRVILIPTRTARSYLTREKPCVFLRSPSLRDGDNFDGARHRFFCLFYAWRMATAISTGRQSVARRVIRA